MKKRTIQNPRELERRGQVYLYYSNKGKTLYLKTEVKWEDYNSKYDIWKPQLNRLENEIIKYNVEHGIRPSVKELKKRINHFNNSGTFYELYMGYIKSLEKTHSISTITAYKNKWRYFRLFREDININLLNNEFVMDFKESIFSIPRVQSKFKDRPGLSNRSAMSVLSLLKRIIEHGIKHQSIKKHEIDWDDVFSFKIEKDIEEALTKEELDFLISKRNSFQLEPVIHDKCVHCGSENIIDKKQKRKSTQVLCKDCGKGFSKYQSRFINNERDMKVALDLFLFQCATSLRISDAIRELKQFKDGDKLIIRALKTKNDQEIPLTKLTRELLDDYDWQFPVFDEVLERRKPKNQRRKGMGRTRYNQLIKKVLKRFSNEMTSFKEIRNDKCVINKEQHIDKVPRYERFGSHSGRRTCVSLMINNNVPETEAMKITGHSDFEIYRGYCDIRPITKVNYLEKIFD